MTGDPGAPSHRRRPSPAALPLLLLVRLYRAWAAPLLGPRCRFEPSCSAYALEALTVHGLFRGAALTAWRLLRCQPFGTAGFDPVPAPRRPRVTTRSSKPTGLSASGAGPC